MSRITLRCGRSFVQVFAGLGETREVLGPQNDANAELFFWNVGAAMNFDVDESADCTVVG